MNIHQVVKNIEQSQQKLQQTKMPRINVGDTVQVNVLIRELLKEDKKSDAKKKVAKSDAEKTLKERIQPYEGTVIAKKKNGIHSTITVRRIFQGIGVERIFTIYSPIIQDIQIKRRVKVRQAKLYYLRNIVGKATRLKEKTTWGNDKL